MTIPLDVPIRLDINNIESLRAVSRQVVRTVHERDHHTCRCCGFRSTKYQQVLNLGSNWRDIDTITTACIFCQQCFALDSAARMRSGVLVTFPEVEQADLNRLAVEIYVARISQNQDAAQQAGACLELLMRKREATRGLLGTDTPQGLAELLHEGERGARQASFDRKLTGVRLLPLDRRIMREAQLEFNQFPQILAFWRSSYGPYPLSGGHGSFLRLEQFAKTHL